MRILVLAAAMAVTLAACQSTRLGGGIDGTWTSPDGVLVSTFTRGSFTSRVTTTGETVVEDGRYSRTGDRLTLAWTSLIANQQRAAECIVSSPTVMTCTPSQGDPFTLTRSA